MELLGTAQSCFRPVWSYWELLRTVSDSFGAIENCGAIWNCSERFDPFGAIGNCSDLFQTRFGLFGTAQSCSEPGLDLPFRPCGVLVEVINVPGMGWVVLGMAISPGRLGGGGGYLN